MSGWSPPKVSTDANTSGTSGTTQPDTKTNTTTDSKQSTVKSSTTPSTGGGNTGTSAPASVDAPVGNGNIVTNFLTNVITSVGVALSAPIMAIGDALSSGKILQVLTSPINAALTLVGIGASVLTGDLFDSYTPVTDGQPAFMNGVFTRYDVGNAQARKMGEAYIKNNSHYGKVGDVLQCVFESLGIITTLGVYTAIAADNGTQRFDLHSQGAASGTNGLRLVPSGTLSNISVTTYGGQVVANAGLLGIRSATNYIADGDPVPYLDPFNYGLRDVGGEGTQTFTVPGQTGGLSFENHSIMPNYWPYMPHGQDGGDTGP